MKTAPTVSVVSLDLLVAIPLPLKTRRKVDALGKAVGKQSPCRTDEDVLAGAVLIFKGRPKHNLAFHVDLLQHNGDDWGVCHIVMRTDAAASRRKTKGEHTAEWVLGEIGKVLGPAELSMDLRCVGMVHGAQLHLQTSGILLEGHEMEPTGIELTHAGEAFEGPTRVRVNRSKAGVEFQLEHRVIERWTADPWGREAERVPRMIAATIAALR